MKNVARGWLTSSISALAILTLGAADIPSSRDFARSAFQRAASAEAAGAFGAAEAGFQDIVWTDDDDNEFADIRANAGIRLGTLLMKQKKFKRAVEAFQEVIDMKGAPADSKEMARKAIQKIKELPGG